MTPTQPHYAPDHVGDRDLPTATRPSDGVNLRAFLSWFKAHYMPGVPLDALTRDDDDYETWEVTTGVEVVTVAVEDIVPGFTVDYEGDDERIDVCYVDPNGREHHGRIYIDADEVAAWLEEHGDPLARSEVAALDGFNAVRLVDGTQEVYVGMVDGEAVCVSDCEYEAEDAAREREQERRYDHPWANGRAYFPADNIRDEDLKAAGYVVAYLKGEHRFAGVDGGGYSFDDAHLLPLAWAMAGRWGLAVRFDDGREVVPV